MTPQHIHFSTKRFSKRMLVCAIAVFMLFAMLIIRLVYLQVIAHPFYATLSKRNIISVIPVKAPRGVIYDRNGVVLAKNTPVYSLMITPGRSSNLKETLEGLEKIIPLSNEDIRTFYHVLRRYYPYQPIPLKQSLSEEEVARFYVDQYRYPGVSIQTNMLRHYPLGNLSSEVTGYTGHITQRELAEVDPSDYTASDEIGKTGIEAEDEVLLHGKTGSEEAEIDANGRVVRILKIKPPIAGDDIYLTIDSKLQAAAKAALGGQRGVVVALDPESGQVLALASNPSYDANLFETGMSAAEYRALTKSGDHSMFNRTINATYSPGSTIKPFLAFGALNMGIINAQDTINDPGWFQLPGTDHIFHNWVRAGFGEVNVTKALIVSCDTFFYQLAATLGIGRLNEAITPFGFGLPTGIDLPGEHSGVLPTPAWKIKHVGTPWYMGDTVVAGIGQGYITVTPMQLAKAVAILAERGRKFQPQLLWRLNQPNGLLTTLKPIEQIPLVANDPAYWQTVINAMHQVVADPRGTAHHSFQGAKYTAAGKTGTSQINRSGDDPKHLTTMNDHIFAGFAPVDQPKIAVVVVVEHISGMTQSAVKVARRVLDTYFEQAEKHPNPSTSKEITQPSEAIQQLLQTDLAQEMRLENTQTEEGDEDDDTKNSEQLQTTNIAPMVVTDNTSENPIETEDEDTLEQNMDTEINKQIPTGTSR